MRRDTCRAVRHDSVLRGSVAGMTLGRSSGRSSPLLLGRLSGCQVGRVCGCGDAGLVRCEAGWLSCGSVCLRARSQTGMRFCRVCGMTGGGQVGFASPRQAGYTAFLLCGRRSCRRAGRVCGLSAASTARQNAPRQARWTGSRPALSWSGDLAQTTGHPVTPPLGLTTCRVDCRPCQPDNYISCQQVSMSGIQRA